MRRLLVTCDYPPIPGGQANYFYNVWSSCDGNEYRLLVPAISSTLCRSMPEKRFDYIGIPMGEEWRSRLLRFVRLLVKTTVVAVRFRPEEIHFGQLIVGGGCGSILRFIFGISYIVHCHGSDVLEFSRYGWGRMVVRIILGNARRILANSRSTALLVTSRYPAIKNVGVVYPSVGEEYFQPAPELTARILRRYDLRDKRVVITVGRLVERKGHDMLIRAIGQVKGCMENIRYLVVGDGPCRDRLKNIAVACDAAANVIFCDYVEQAELTAYYRAASLFAMVPRYLEDKGDIEGFGIVYLEACAAGLPILASNSGGVSEIVKDGINGMLVDPLDPRAIAEALKKVFSDAAFRTSLSRNAIAMAERFSKERQKKAWLEAVGGG